MTYNRKTNEYMRDYQRRRRASMIACGLIVRKQKEHIYRSDDEIFEIAKRFKTLEDFRKSEPSVYQISIKRGLIKKFTWLSRPFRWTRELCESESRKYEGMWRSGFRKGSQGAYYASLNNGWIDSFVWLGSKQNPHTDKIYVCYKYEFTDFHAVYVGLTMNPAERDYSHRTAPKGTKSAVFKFAESHKCDIPQMTILHKHLSCEQAQDCEDFYVKKFRRLGWKVLNKARTGVGVGSIGTTAFKWTKPKVFEEARKYLRRKHFEEGCSTAYEVARKNHWLDEMTWMPNPKERVKKEKPIKKRKEKLIFTDEQIRERISEGMTFSMFKNENPEMAKFLKDSGIVKKYFGAMQVVAFSADGSSIVFPSAKYASKYLGMSEEIINKVAGRREGKQTSKGWVFRHFGDIEPWYEMRMIFKTTHHEKIRDAMLRFYNG